ncbi:MAG: ferritin-like domain-containing protein [Hyphomonadaceae bacterium]|nr:ferritin-like domain-containing protein [Hyphomonadaceae bacterium]
MANATQTREALIARLSEAAEVEHNLMCVYLYAAFSLKDGEADGLSPAEAEAVRRWRGEILAVAREEMVHLLLVSNLLTAVGGAAHFGRMNFPIPPGSLPAEMQVRLAPFDRDTLQHLIWLERPDGVDEPMGEGFQPIQRYERGMRGEGARLMPHAIDYPTVGALYAQLESDLDAIAARLGEDTLFIGPRTGQIDATLIAMPGVTAVVCLATAHAAIRGIVEQGEGARIGDATSHYARFKTIARDYDALLAANPGFAPAHPAAHNPVMRRPPTPEGKVWIEAEQAAVIVDLANAIYAHMLRLLTQAFGRTGPEAERAALIDAAIATMVALTPAAEAATRFPARDGDASCRAGMSFATLRSMTPLPSGAAEWRMLSERLGEIAATAARIEAWHPKLASARAILDAAYAQFARQAAAFAEAPAAVALSSVAAAPPPRTAPASTVADGVEVVEGAGLTLLFEAKRCIHARFCVTGLPAVFKANVEGPWIDPDAASVEALVAVAHACPSGAIRYRRKDGGPQEAPPPVNLARLRENGPYAVHADIDLAGHGPMTRATLCRCGASKTKPFCDGSHAAAGFAATGEPATRESEPLAVRGGALAIVPQPNGPLQVRGPLEICAGTGRTVDRVTSARLCRCGGSKTKPFCDNSHLTNGFTAD